MLLIKVTPHFYREDELIILNKGRFFLYKIGKGFLFRDMYG